MTSSDLISLEVKIEKKKFKGGKKRTNRKKIKKETPVFAVPGPSRMIRSHSPESYVIVQNMNRFWIHYREEHKLFSLQSVTR